MSHCLSVYLTNPPPSALLLTTAHGTDCACQLRAPLGTPSHSQLGRNTLALNFSWCQQPYQNQYNPAANISGSMFPHSRDGSTSNDIQFLIFLLNNHHPFLSHHEKWQNLQVYPLYGPHANSENFRQLFLTISQMGTFLSLLTKLEVAHLF